MSNPVLMRHIKQAEIRSTNEGCNLLSRLIATPGLIVKSIDVIEDSLTSAIDEGGGSVWWCGSCDMLCMPNMNCSCAALDDAGTKCLLMLTQNELSHVLRALKFCKHAKSKTQLHSKDEEWITTISSVIDRVESDK